jgi:hypothetical protein
MTLTELRQEVYNITNRPALVAQTLTAIRSATLKLHQLDYFYKDIVEQGVSFLIPAYLQSLEYRTLFPRWRALKYLRKTDSTGKELGQIYTVISPESVLDQYHADRENVCYVAGAVVQIRSSAQLQYCIVGRYDNPDITEGGYNSWIALNHPYAIVFEAASLVFKMIGDTDQFAAYTGLAAMQAAEVKLSNIQAVGY